MAISFKADKDYGYSLLPLFGVNPSLIQTAQTAGVTVDQSSPGTFVIKLGELVYGSVPVKGSAISLAKSKTLGPASKEALQFQFESALKKAIAGADTAMWDGLSVNKNGSPPPHPAHATPKPGKVQMTTPSPNLTGIYPSVPKAPTGKFSKQDPCPLYKATKVYTPVTGTTGGSVYFVLAVFDGLNVAARVQGSKLSLRAEGPNLNEFQEALEDFGMDAKGGYSSGHYDVSNTGLMIKSLGALVGRIGFDRVKEVADISKFIGGQ